MSKFLVLSVVSSLIGLFGTTATTHQATAANCDRSYPTICIPSPPPDLDCKDIKHRNFKVLQPDPHRFDGDQDGIGCETRSRS